MPSIVAVSVEFVQAVHLRHEIRLRPWGARCGALGGHICARDRAHSGETADRYREYWEGFSVGLKGPVKFELSDLRVFAGGTIGYGYSMQHVIGTDTKGQPIDPTVRVTDGDRKVNGRWRTLEVIEGGLPRRALALAREWAREHRDELMEDWELCRQRQTPTKTIEPLR